MQRREFVMRQYFPESLIERYENLIPSMKNDPKDRHLLAACVVNGTKLIVTYNRRDFPSEILAPYGVECQGPSTFLMHLYDLESGIVARKLTGQTQNIGQSMESLLLKLRVNVPGFVSAFCEARKIEL